MGYKADCKELSKQLKNYPGTQQDFIGVCENIVETIDVLVEKIEDDTNSLLRVISDGLLSEREDNEGYMYKGKFRPKYTFERRRKEL